MNADEILNALHADHLLAQEVLQRLQILTPWKQRTRPHRSGCEEWERADLRSGGDLAEVYHADWMGHWGAMCDEDEGGLDRALPSRETAMAELDAVMAAAGWHLMPGSTS